jgi:hypothetical protein
MVTASKRYLAEKPDEERKVVFLDIDGVLQRGIAQDRFNHDLDGLKCKLSKEYNDDTFLGMDKYDVGAVYYDWNKLSVDVLRDLLNDCNAEIVLSSDWRMSKDLTQMRALFKIHKLDKYLTELVPATGRFPNKKVDIKAYLEEHPKLDRYAVIDDLYMEDEFKGRFVYSDHFLRKENYNEIYRLLEFGPWWGKRYQKEYDRGDLGHLIEDKFEKVIFLDIDGVLNDDGRDRENGIIIDSEFAGNLHKIVEVTGAEIVLSSSWRNGVARDALYGSGDDEGLRQLYDAFERHRLHIAGATPMIYNGPNGRPLEIRTWLVRRPDVKKFVILDDDTFWNWGWLEPFVVTTSYILRRDRSSSPTDERICGLDEEYAQKAIEILA